MKAKYHIFFGILIPAILFFIDPNFITRFLSTHFDVITLVFGAVIYFIGILLPDSDTAHAKSRIFYTSFFVFGIINRMLEYPLAILLSRKIGHRESLHTIIGVFFSSVFFSIIFFIVLFFIESLLHIDNINSLTFLFLFFCVFLGQLMHLLCDWHWRLK